MNSLQDKAAIATGASAEIAVVVARQNKRKMIGILLCVGAVVVVAAGWAMALSNGAISTDNAYVRGDVTSLAGSTPSSRPLKSVDKNGNASSAERLAARSQKVKHSQLLTRLH